MRESLYNEVSSMTTREHTEEEQFSLKNLFVPFTNLKAIHFLVIIGLVIFGNGLFNNFVGDDNAQIVDNKAIHSLTNMPAFFFENRLDNGGAVKLGATYFKPLLDTSYALTYSLWGLNFFGYHLFQISFYIINACLVYFLFKRYFKPPLAFVLALLFLIHPLNSENALYIADTQDMLFFFFGMIGLLILQHENLTGRKLAAAFLMFFLSLLSKETGILFFLPAFYLILQHTRLHRLYFIGGTVLTGIVYAALRWHAIGLVHHELVNAPIGRLSLDERLLNLPAIVFFYLKTFFFPLALSTSWQWVYKTVDSSHFFIPLAFDFIWIAFLIAFAIFLFKKKSKHSALFVLFSLWLLGGTLFHGQLLPLDQTVADRWFYFPMVGVLGCIGILAETLHLKLRNPWTMTVICCLLLILAGRSFVRTFDYRDDFVLATHDVQVAPESYNFEYMISHIYYQSGQLAEAKKHAEKSVELFPYITNYTNLGAIESKMGNYAAAKTAYLNALRYGDDLLPYENLASLSFVYGTPQENSQFIKNVALKKYPNDTKLWFALIVTEYTHGMKNEARADLRSMKENTNVDLGALEDIVQNNKPLSLQIKDGNVMFIMK